MALVPPIDPALLPPDAVRAALAPLRNDFSVALVAPGNAFAVGAVIRVAHSFLAREVFVVGEGDWYREGIDGNAQIRDARAAGRTGRAPPSDRGKAALGCREGPREAVDLRGRALPPGVVLLFGSERFGVPRELIDRADEVVGIPMYGVNHSFPVAVAAGIAMHEWARRRYRDGAVV